ncbi:MAG: hypothetical protein B7Z47_01705 [Chthoniobacter sp. 12-60-6]|nr:MAG: hypothetical protein B7Z47_01705 [Chthoniobacter sp. 12-60-6]
MSSFLRSLADFMEPAGLLWLMLSMMLGLKLWRRQWRAMLLPGAAWLLLTLASATALSHALLGSLESEWPQVDMAQLPECDAIIVLGGGVEPSEREPAGLHFKSAADRLFAGLRLARMGKGRLLVIGGGSIETKAASVSEADGVKLWLDEWKLAPVQVQSLGSCLDTHDEAVKVAALASKDGWKQVALVTSAYHMTRAKAVFEKAGVAVVPVPCNYLSAAMRDQKVKWLTVPNATNLTLCEMWMHEIIGWWAYWVRGWI